MIKEATILDLAEIEELMTKYEGFDCYDYVRASLLNKEIYWFYKKNTAMVFMPLDNFRYDMHIYNDAPGDKDLRNWCISVGAYMLEKTPAMALLNFVKEDRRDLRLFMASIGCRKVCKIRDEIMYSAEYEDKERIKARIK